jgi:hypothetical protein
VSRRRRRSSRRPFLLFAGLAALAAGAAAVRRSGRARALPDSVGRAASSLPDSLGRVASSLPGPLRRSQLGQEDWQCACGARYRVSGLDRHRVYWPAGASEGEAVLGTDCVSCGRPLPA